MSQDSHSGHLKVMVSCEFVQCCSYKNVRKMYLIYKYKIQKCIRKMQATKMNCNFSVKPYF